MNLKVFISLGLLAYAVNSQCTSRVVVVGAGASGLGAASYLKKLGCDVTVLESRNRLGGRVNTSSFGTGVTDLGASWIHGIGPAGSSIPNYNGKYNPIYQIA